MNVRVVGVRHHSPSCAALVKHLIEKHRPTTILIEGPADFNPRIDELFLEHEPPLAIFSYNRDELLYRRTYTPFCSYSPEWVALKTAFRLGIDCYFMDLPAWTRPFLDIENRYHDADRSRDYVGRLCEKLGLNGMDELWDHLFEQPRPLGQLEEGLSQYFAALRECSIASPSDEEREDFMARFISWAEGRGTVLAVCGGFHKPALDSGWKTKDGTCPTIPLPEHEGRHGSFLVPYSYGRLDSFTGYSAGMPSPRYYQILWQEGAEAAHKRAFALIVERLRRRKVLVSAADLIAGQCMIQGLTQLRGHQVPTRVDLLDGLVSTLLKHGLEHQLPWTHRAPLTSATEPILVEMLAALAGHKEGSLAAGTPLPPLYQALEETLRHHDLYPERVRRQEKVRIGELKSQTLHQLLLLQIPGFSLQSEATGIETWSVVLTDEFAASVIEAGAYGTSLEDAAISRLEELVESFQDSAAQLAKLFDRAYRADLRHLPERLVQELESLVGAEKCLAELGEAGGVFLALWRSFEEPPIERLLRCFTRQSLWLIELVAGPNETAKPTEIRAYKTLGRCFRALSLDPTPLLDLLQRRVAEPAAPPAHRGSALGLLWVFSQSPNLIELSIENLQACSEPARMGDFLAGLLGVAREEMLNRVNLVVGVDKVISNYSEEQFLVALPALRLAFSFFPPREKEQIARVLLKELDEDYETAWRLVQNTQDPVEIAHNRVLEERVDSILVRHGLQR